MRGGSACRRPLTSRGGGSSGSSRWPPRRPTSLLQHAPSRRRALHSPQPRSRIKFTGSCSVGARGHGRQRVRRSCAALVSSLPGDSPARCPPSTGALHGTRAACCLGASPGTGHAPSLPTPLPGVIVDGHCCSDLLHVRASLVPHARAHDAPASLVPRRLAAPPPAAFRTPRTCTHRWRCFAPWERRTQVTVIRCMCHTGVCALPEPRPAQFGSSCSLTPRTATGERCERCPEMSSHLCVPVSAERDVEFACRKLLKRGIE